MLKTFSLVKEKTVKKIRTVKAKVGKKFETIKVEFNKNYQEAKAKPISKRKSALLGFSTVLGIFGVVLFMPTLAAYAKDIPEKKPTECPKPNQSKQVTPVPTAIRTTNILSGAAASVCAAAVGSGSFIVGIICGAVVAGGILYAQRHK